MEEIKKAYAAMIMQCLGAKAAGLRTRLQPWQVSTAFNTMVQDFAQMDAFASQGLQANASAFTGIEQHAKPKKELTFSELGAVEDRVATLETTVHKNSDVLNQILAKVS